MEEKSVEKSNAARRALFKLKIVYAECIKYSLNTWPQKRYDNICRIFALRDPNSEMMEASLKRTTELVGKYVGKQEGRGATYMRHTMCFHTTQLWATHRNTNPPAILTRNEGGVVIVP